MNNSQLIFMSDAQTIPEAWAKAVEKVFIEGRRVATAYDKKGDLPSIEATSTILVHDPFAEPRISKRVPCGLEELEIYRLEVTHGVHDHWIGSSPTAWTYTYHDRLFNYIVPHRGAIDQMESVYNSICEDVFIEGRRYQAITWVPEIDRNEEHCPCLQRLFFRIAKKDEDSYYLNMHSDWRSRDLWGAWLMNVHALTELQRLRQLQTFFVYHLIGVLLLLILIIL
jgi:thymidylate synthase